LGNTALSFQTLDPNSWVEPTVEWLAPIDAPALHERLTRKGELLTTWPATPFETTATHCFRLDDHYWISQMGVGAVSFNTSAPRLSAFPFPDGDPSWFRDVIRRSWLPAIYPFWGRQVLHASAVAARDTGGAVAFTGLTHAGKSTTAYGLGRRDGWRLLADDTVAFSPSKHGGERDIHLYPLQNEIRLRPASAEYFTPSPQSIGPIEWPEGKLRLRAVYLLDGEAECDSPVEFTRLRSAEGLPLLLQQAYALSFEIPTYNQKLMSDYARLAASVPMFRLRFHRSFAAAGDLFVSLDAHIATQVELVASQNSAQSQA
jgi:hypothetical protein